MTLTTSALTPCQYLFQKEAELLFPAQDAGFINESLVTLMKIVDHLVRENPEALFLFTPTAFNNQCHLYSLFVAQAVNQAKIQSAVGSIMPDSPESIDRRFLYLSFFLSFAFLSSQKLLEKLACKTLTVMEAAAPSKAFKVFLKDSQGLRTHASRSALNVLFKEHMQKLFNSGEGPLDSELGVVANEDLQLAPILGKGTLYTFPKLAGVAYFIEALSKEKIALLFKVKVVANEGIGSFMYSSQNLQAFESRAPLIVFEMVATGPSLTYLEYREIAKKCPTHSRRNVSSKNCHKATESCLSCSHKRLDVGPYEQKFQPVLASAKDTLLALGADFILQSQQSFLGFFSDRERFPRLTALFEASVSKIECCFLSMNQPLNMSVSHVYTDSVGMALRNELVMDATYETHLKNRGLV